MNKLEAVLEKWHKDEAAIEVQKDDHGYCTQMEQ